MFDVKGAMQLVLGTLLILFILLIIVIVAWAQERRPKCRRPRCDK